MAAEALSRAGRPGQVLSRPAVRISLLIAVIAAAGLALYVTRVAGAAAPAGRFHVHWWFLAPLFLLTEAYPVHVHFRRETHSLSMSDFALVLGLYLAAPSDLLAGLLVGCAAAVLLVRRQRALKAAFNLSQFGLTGCLAIVVFRAILGDGTPYGIAGWLGALVGASLAAVAGVALVAVAIKLTDGDAEFREMFFVAAVGVTSALTSASLAIAVLEIVQADARAIWVLAVPVTISAIAFHAYTRQRRRRQHLEFLYTSMRAIQSAPDLGGATRALLEEARRMVSAEHGELIMLPRSEDSPILRSVIDGEGETLLEPVELSPAAELALRGTSLSEHALLLRRGREPHVLDDYLAEIGVADAVVSGIRGESGFTGMLLLGERSGDVVSFTIDDRRLLQTFANHAGVVLENDQVREQLQYQAFHDDLTGLANRVLFTAQVSSALREGSGELLPVVLFLDLDDFKTINDSLGHRAGDELLIAVAQRIRACAGYRGLPARLGGDEFGLLLRATTSEKAEEMAHELLDRFKAPITLDGREFRVHPSIGIAAAEGPETTAEELLRNADVAMYSAKDSGKRCFARYEPEMHARAKRRQELASDLERAVEHDEIRVHYQPIVELTTGQILSFEALARWEHPDHGLLPPASFIPLAEETGLTAAIGRIVRSEACRQIARWRAAYPGAPLLGVSANLSSAELQNPGLADEVAATLAEAGLDSEHLVLEITESSALQDPDATAAKLQDLRRLGVRVALDDFGTGYSSLSHLRDLPIDLIKIAKPFVDGLASSDTAETFVMAILQIARALRLDVIAEGIERPEQARILDALSCEIAQGYYYSRPLDAEAADAYLRQSLQWQWRQAGERTLTVAPSLRSVSAS